MSAVDEDFTGSSPEENIIKYGTLISLKHDATGRFLTSQADNVYEEGSGQQKVFASESADSDAQFIVLPRAGDGREPGEDVNFGDVVRLKHAGTRANLHTHPDIPSPVTEQQEVTCYGDDSLTDENDEWVVEPWSQEEDDDEYDAEDPTWYIGRPFVLKHIATGVTLHSHEETIDDDNYEVCGYGDGPDDNDRWVAVAE